MQAIPLPEVGEVPEDPGQLPQPDKVTKAYFEVCPLLPLFTLKISQTLWETKGRRGRIIYFVHSLVTQSSNDVRYRH